MGGAEREAGEVQRAGKAEGPGREGSSQAEVTMDHVCRARTSGPPGEGDMELGRPR